MKDTAIQVNNLTKEYRLGVINHGTLSQDLQSWWAKIRGKEDPNSIVDIHDRASGRYFSKRLNTHFHALHHVSFSVKQGETLGVIGRNGAGKSTLLKILSRITAPSGGEIKIKGCVASLLEVGTGFHPELTGRENIYLNGAILGMRRFEVKKKLDEIVAFSEVERFIDTPVKRYSSGMYVRLAFAVAAHLDPEILIVDEVLAVGDAQFQKKCIGKMETINKEGRTIIFVSHNMITIQALCNRSMLLTGGEISMAGKTADVVKTYLSSLKESGRIVSSLANIQRAPGLGERVRFTKCSLINDEDHITTEYLYGEHISLYLEAVSTHDMNDLSFVVGVDTIHGNRIVTVASEEQGKLFTTAKSRSIRIRFRLDDVILTPGSYWLHLGIRSGRHGLDEIKNVIAFDVLDSAKEGIKPHPGTWGYIYARADWSRLE